MDIQRYLQRMKYEGSLEPNLATLRALQLAHLRAIPFENLDIHLGRRITLDPAALFDKIVLRGRGGFCYELNGLFAALLSHLGFVVVYLSASDAHPDGSFGLEFDHLALAVQCPGDAARWLVDVGWGDTFCVPLDLDATGEQPEGRRAYQIAREGDYHMLWQRGYDGRWERQYRFTLQPRNFIDFVEMCHYHQTSPESLFVKSRICTLATGDGRITLDDSRFITTRHGERHEQPIDDEEAYRPILAERFGITL
ncbi:MAG: arylamine N-acetyltransferase [Nitrospira sp.]|nr:arylamine N-acetyltransferase [Nitrospira sp.]